MRAKIIKMLQESGEEFISGQDLCQELGISRQGVWKNINSLKEIGYEIESVSRKGYRLLSKPDRLYGPEIESYLSENSICTGIEWYDSIDSTNLRAKQLAEEGAGQGILVVAEEQTAGRGRRGRGWQSEAGVGIFMTMLLRPQIEPQNLSGVTLIAALAVNTAIHEICGVDSKIKWPNDIVLNGKKICGILTEMSSESNYVHYAVVGIGINANHKRFPQDIASVASSIFLETGILVDRARLVGTIVNYFGKYYRTFLQKKDLSDFIADYNLALVNYGNEVRVYYGMVEQADDSEVETGIARGIDRTGALIVEIDGQYKTIVSGEVSVRGVCGYV